MTHDISITRIITGVISYLTDFRFETDDVTDLAEQWKRRYLKEAINVNSLTASVVWLSLKLFSYFSIFMVYVSYSIRQSLGKIMAHRICQPENP